jgi:IstB-like ATP binding protein
LLVDREATSRENKRLARRLRDAKLRQAAVVEDVNLHAPRGLDRALFQKLATCEWLREHHHLVVIGPTGPVNDALPRHLIGKTDFVVAGRVILRGYSRSRGAPPAGRGLLPGSDIGRPDADLARRQQPVADQMARGDC